MDESELAAEAARFGTACADAWANRASRCAWRICWMRLMSCVTSIGPKLVPISCKGLMVLLFWLYPPLMSPPRSSRALARAVSRASLATVVIGPVENREWCNPSPTCANWKVGPPKGAILANGVRGFGAGTVAFAGSGVVAFAGTEFIAM